MSIKSIVLLFYFLNINGNQVNSINVSNRQINNQTQKLDRQASDLKTIQNQTNNINLQQINQQNFSQKLNGSISQKEGPKILSQTENGKLSEKMIIMASKYPETVVLESKLKKLEKIEPKIEQSLDKLHNILKFPKETPNGKDVIKLIDGVQKNANINQVDQKQQIKVVATQKDPHEQPKIDNNQQLQKAEKERLKTIVKEQLTKQGINIEDKDVKIQIKKIINKEVQKLDKDKLKVLDISLKAQNLIASKDSKKLTQVDQNQTIAMPITQNQNVSISQKNTTTILMHNPADININVSSTQIAQTHNTTLQKKQNLIQQCQEGQDEIFDNCVKDVSKEEKEEEQENEEFEHFNPTDIEISSKEYGKAAIALVESVSDKLNFQGDKKQIENPPK